MKISRTLALASAAVAAVGTFAVASPALAATATLKQASIDDHAGDCPDGIESAHIILNQIGTAPSTITVYTSAGELEVPLFKKTGSAAHYYADLEGADLEGAIAEVPSGWKGQFVLSHYVCGTSTYPPSGPTS